MKPAALTKVNGKGPVGSDRAAAGNLKMFQFGTFRQEGAARRQHLI
jgi:hypothetical protein